MGGFALIACHVKSWCCNVEKTEKLNLSEWSDKNRQRMLSLIDLLSDKRRSHLSEHLVLLRHPPPLNDSREEFKKYLAIPTTFALLIYGAEELDALYELAAIKTETLKEMESDKAGEFIHQYIYLWQWASQALLAVALGRDDVVLSVFVWRMRTLTTKHSVV